MLPAGVTPKDIFDAHANGTERRPNIKDAEPATGDEPLNTMSIRWIEIHWFELATLGLLGLNLWFLIAVLRVLRSVNHWLIFFSGWINEVSETRQVEGNSVPTREAGREGGCD